MKRLFAALKIHPDESFLSSFHNLRSSLRHEQIKWVEDKNIHITLKFFGETDERDIMRIIEVLSARAAKTPVLNISLRGLGLFGSAYNPRVVWTGAEPLAELSALMQALHADLEKAGFSSDRQNLVPHLTLGRIKSVKDKILFQKIINQFGDICSASEPVGEIILFESILKRDGPDYHIADRFPLQ
jgi:2'-5' RNA ligase